MSNYRSIFPKRHTFLAVVHAQSEAQALKNVFIAEKNGADGVFLINHEIAHPALLRIYQTVRAQFPAFWIGLNMLDIVPLHALGLLPEDAGGFWVDNAGIRDSDVSTAQRFDMYCKGSPWQGLYFGGVAFKYQEVAQDPARAAELAKPYADVITTSGDSTGSAPAPDKIKKMKAAIGAHPLAIASGITPENAQSFADADCFLVVTGVSYSHTELNPKRVRALADVLAP